MANQLTAKRELYARELAKGNTQIDAYCTAFPMQGKNSKINVLRVRAYELAKDPRIIARVKELQVDALKHVKYDIEAHFNELEQAKELSMTPRGKYGDMDTSTMLKAIELKGKVKGLYTIKVENTNTDLPATKEQLETRLIEIAEREGLTLEEFKRREGLD